jgi:LmbE family N-acetylglucosaminyl deacetylase
VLNNLDSILVLAPHTDDGEFGCGGTMAKFVAEGKDVWYVAFSAAEKSVPDEFPRDILRKEVIDAMAVIGVPEEHQIILSYPVREFPLHRQDILDDMINLGEKIKPDVVFLPSTYDTHQDHQTIAQEGFRAFKRITMLGYEIPWNNLTFPTQTFVFLEEEYINKKIQALKCYLSQQDRFYASEDFIRSLARTRGTQIGTKYGEVFELIRWVIK